MMRWLVKNIPNLFTLLNLSLGVLAINIVLTSSTDDTPVVHYYVLAAGVCDLLDGFLARKLKVQSEFGLQLDSLADLITFGVLPMFIYAQYVPLEGWGLFLLLVPVCSAIRLAIFNIDDDQKTVFKGISTTAHGVFVALLPIIIYNQNGWIGNFLSYNFQVLLIVALFFSWLMVSPLKMTSLKFNDWSLSSNWQRYLLLLLSLILVIILGYGSAPYIMLFYIVLSVVSNFQSLSSKSTD